MECIEVCDDDVLCFIIQIEDFVVILWQNWDFWIELFNMLEEYNCIDDLEEKIGLLEIFLFNKEAY